ncbi:Testis-expressed protein 13A [Camelus dromedarius]|uniref:Testis-expressed protein 13A n=1 Tax=Camelus dromedarius TaxID=9838 RepID=A0A5N4C337_CAMDR|nr:Testis-expressed protein 13A [Camelus dromedarius]
MRLGQQEGLRYNHSWSNLCKSQEGRTESKPVLEGGSGPGRNIWREGKGWTRMMGGVEVGQIQDTFWGQVWPEFMTIWVTGVELLYSASTSSSSGWGCFPILEYSLCRRGALPGWDNTYGGDGLPWAPFLPPMFLELVQSQGKSLEGLAGALLPLEKKEVPSLSGHGRQACFPASPLTRGKADGNQGSCSSRCERGRGEEADMRRLGSGQLIPPAGPAKPQRPSASMALKPEDPSGNPAWQGGGLHQREDGQDAKGLSSTSRIHPCPGGGGGQRGQRGLCLGQPGLGMRFAHRQNQLNECRVQCLHDFARLQKPEVATAAGGRWSVRRRPPSCGGPGQPGRDAERKGPTEVSILPISLQEGSQKGQAWPLLLGLGQEQVRWKRRGEATATSANASGTTGGGEKRRQKDAEMETFCSSSELWTEKLHLWREGEGELSVSQAGDCDCPWCKAVNFSRRETCFRCGRGIWLQSPQGARGEGKGGRMGLGEWTDQERHVLMTAFVFQSTSIRHPRTAAASVCMCLSPTLVSAKQTLTLGSEQRGRFHSQDGVGSGPGCAGAKPCALQRPSVLEDDSVSPREQTGTQKQRGIDPVTPATDCVVADYFSTSCNYADGDSCIPRVCRNEIDWKLVHVLSSDMRNHQSRSGVNPGFTTRQKFATPKESLQAAYRGCQHQLEARTVVASQPHERESSLVPSGQNWGQSDLNRALMPLPRRVCWSRPLTKGWCHPESFSPPAHHQDNRGGGGWSASPSSDDYKLRWRELNQLDVTSGCLLLGQMWTTIRTGGKLPSLHFQSGHGVKRGQKPNCKDCGVCRSEEVQSVLGAPLRGPLTEKADTDLPGKGVGNQGGSCLCVHDVDKQTRHLRVSKDIRSGRGRGLLRNGTWWNNCTEWGWGMEGEKRKLKWESGRKRQGSQVVPLQPKNKGPTGNSVPSTLRCLSVVEHMLGVHKVLCSIPSASVKG